MEELTRHWWGASVLGLHDQIVEGLDLPIEGIVEHGRDETHVRVDGEQRLAPFHRDLLQRVDHRSVVPTVSVCRYHRQYRHAWIESTNNRTSVKKVET